MQHAGFLDLPRRSLLEAIRANGAAKEPGRQFSEFELKGIRLYVADFVARLRGVSLEKAFLRRLTHEAFYLLRWRLNYGLSVDAALEELERDTKDIESTKWYPRGFWNNQRNVTHPATWAPMGHPHLTNRRCLQKAGAKVPV